MTKLAILLLALPACMIGSGENDAPLAFDDWQTTYVRSTTGPTGSQQLFYDWDQTLTRDQETKLYQQYVSAKTAGVTQSEATVNLTLYGNDIWPVGERVQTYCVSNAFGQFKPAVLQAIATATGDWTNASGGTIGWEYHPEWDGACDTNAPLTFDAVPIDQEGGLYAQAFFPSTPRAQRELYINLRTVFYNAPPVPLEGLLRHELGHSLGLRHETARAQGIVEYGWQCYENVFIRPLTQYDDYSLMATPACTGLAGIKNPSLTITALDAQGVRELYQ